MDRAEEELCGGGEPPERARGRWQNADPLRVARGNYGAMNVLEDLTEDFVARDMQANNL